MQNEVCHFPSFVFFWGLYSNVIMSDRMHLKKKIGVRSQRQSCYCQYVSKGIGSICDICCGVSYVPSNYLAPIDFLFSFVQVLVLMEN